MDYPCLFVTAETSRNAARLSLLSSIAHRRFQNDRPRQVNPSDR